MPRKGYKQTKEHRQKIREARLGTHRTEKTKEKMGLNHKGGPKVGHEVSEETREKNRKAHLGAPHPHKGGAKKSFYNNTWFRSGWEAKYAEYLDKWSIKWEYEPHRFLLEIEGKKTFYTPDFYLPEMNLYHEVKGWNHPGFDNTRKVQPARDQCEINLTIIDEKLLKRMGIL